MTKGNSIQLQNQPCKIDLAAIVEILSFCIQYARTLVKTPFTLLCTLVSLPVRFFLVICSCHSGDIFINISPAHFPSCQYSSLSVLKYIGIFQNGQSMHSCRYTLLLANSKSLKGFKNCPNLLST